MAVFHHHVWAKRLGNVFALQQFGPQIFHLLHRVVAATQNAETNIDAAVLQRKRPCVTRQQIFFEPHVQPFFGWARHGVCILPKRMPFTQVSGRRHTKRFSHGRPHAVGCNNVLRTNCAQVFYININVFGGVLFHVNKTVAFHHSNAARLCQLH